MEKPLISIIMPAYNAAETIGKALYAIRTQNYPQDKIEILVVDGGSTDHTREIAAKYKAIVLNNKKKLPETAKEIGFCACSGKYALYVDADEIFKNPDSLNKRVKIFKEHPDVKSITATGKISAKGASPVTIYSNYVSDPFSYFVYRLDGNNRMKEMKGKYRYTDFEDYTIFYTTLQLYK
ncbi:hypothetical protein C823_002011 [Eubacterium plexicaudatum ASF492]|uniref:Glycosyltransferase 2-like domain-containing protein n=1 Tax=Eubacterium plexicaudatum ASF492 TaxID=1235802 RepID=N2BAY6_9FIRM|nr:hypothetical protein C823_002011 [Eubacterium plexicaudatum ASF492]